MKEIQSVIFMVFFGVSIGVNAERAILFQDKTITIYTDNTVVYADGSVPVFKPSSTWVEEDYFTQQEKYCEVDSIHKDKLKDLLNSFKK
ncbi:MAG: hypothetical protein K0U04_04630 [Proteobacteria bacterium]|jgi:hypothetical protein|nr:hypothetical protein [Pseudomonadota bacterium]